MEPASSPSAHPAEIRGKNGVRDSRFWLAAIAGSSDDAIVGHDLNGIVTSWNNAAEAMFGYPLDEILGQPIGGIIPPDRVAEDAATFDQILYGEKPVRFETTRKCRDGRIIAVALAVAPVRDDQNRCIGVSTIAHDLSERDEREQLLRSANAELERLAAHLVHERYLTEQANRAKSNFIAGMSHELRTPLNGILGYAQLLRTEGVLTPTQGTRVDAMLEAGRHLLEMITCVLDLSEIDAENVTLRSVAVDVQAIASACLDLVRPAAQAKNLALSFTVALGTPAELVVDPMRLRQVLLNLLSNAVKFTGKGTIQLGLRTLPDGSALRIEVTDTGPGIPAHQRVGLFQDFERIDAPGTMEGAGLGLALSARLATLMGGRLSRDDNPSGGSLFWLDLPLDTVSLPLRVVAPPVAVDPAEAVRTLHVLVVDDIAMNRDIAGSFLRSAGHEVTCVECGSEAISAVAATDFDVVLMDVRMPEMDGLEATRRIRALGSDRGKVPIVALTAQCADEQVAECHSAGMDDHLPKPFDPDALHAVVLRAFAARQPLRGITNPTPALAAIPNTASPPHEISVIGMEVPVLDLRVFERATISLVPDMVAAHLRTITERAEDLLHELSVPNALIQSKQQLAEAALTLAGSAGMLGFKRVTAVGRRFERAVMSDAIEIRVLAYALNAALEATLNEIHDRMSVAVGAGLGLALSARLAASLGGRRGHSENPNGGSVFWMELPLDRAAGPPPAATLSLVEPPMPQTVAAMRALKVLVVDDIAMNRDIAGCFLGSAGHIVTCVDDGEGAVSAAASTDFDVVLMDIRMPGMDGLEATRRIRALDGVRARVPIVALTANTFAEQMADCRNAGMDDHLAKPFDLDKLLAVVTRATAATAARQEPNIRSAVSLPAEPVAEATPERLIGAALPVFDRAAFDRTAIFLAPGAVASYLQTIAERGEPLLRGLWGRDALTRIRFELADAAHTLAGSAGMLGFERLASLGYLFDRAVQSDAIETPALANGLSAALEATLQEIHDRISASLGPELGLALSARLTALMAGRRPAGEDPQSAAAVRPEAAPASVAEPVAAVVTPVEEPQPPVLDIAAFERTAAFLAPAMVVTYLGTLAERGDALLLGLRGADALTRCGDELATSAHTLAGSAGLLGFKRVTAAARSFEHGVQSGAANAPALAEALSAAIEATLQEIRNRVPVAAES